MEPADSTPLKPGPASKKMKMIETFWIFWAIMLVVSTASPTAVSLGAAGNQGVCE